MPPSSLYSPREEFANALTHGVGFLVSASALVYMMRVMPPSYSAVQTVGVIVYGVSLMLMFLSSTLYHAINHPNAKPALKRFDHCAIYLLIAGTYTPIFTIAVQSNLSIVILIIVWGMAVIGVVFKAFFAGRFERLSVGVYLAMGWIGAVMLYKVYQDMETAAFALLLGGGLLYSAGVIFYVNKRIPFNHAIWHCFVAGGALCHCLLIAKYIVGAG
ncbi:MAG: PAQR family membrane homeostasis protein TrhA [Maricaulaceae bacterium]